MRLAILLFVLLLNGCQDATNPTLLTMAGSWSGTVDASSFSFTSTENDQVVSGNGHISVGTSSIALTVTGTHVHPDVSLTIHLSGFQDIAFSGQFVDPNQVSGRLNGSGYNNRQFVLNRP